MKKILLFVLFSLISGMLFAQSNEIIDSLLGEKKADFGRTAYMVLSASSLVDDSSAVSDVLAKLQDEKWKALSLKKADDEVTFGEYSFLVMKAFSLPGGIMYHLFPSKRYALRELKYGGYIDKICDPSSPMSGDDVLRILGYILADREERK